MILYKHILLYYWQKVIFVFSMIFGWSLVRPDPEILYEPDPEHCKLGMKF